MTERKKLRPTPAPPAITDPLRMRAMAHPLRIKLLETLHREGPLTATRAAELLNDSPGNMSWHLQTLAKYGFVEEAPGGRGRSRPWQRATDILNFDTSTGGPEQAAAGDALENTFLERNVELLRNWWSQRRSYSAKWRKGAFSHDRLTYLTSEELHQLGEDMRAVADVYRERDRNRDVRPAGAQPVHIVSWGHPLPPTPSGN